MAVVRGGTVRSHVQRFADECSEKATGAKSFGTYTRSDSSGGRNGI